MSDMELLLSEFVLIKYEPCRIRESAQQSTATFQHAIALVEYTTDVGNEAYGAGGEDQVEGIRWEF